MNALPVTIGNNREVFASGTAAATAFADGMTVFDTGANRAGAGAAVAPSRRGARSCRRCLYL